MTNVRGSSTRRNRPNWGRFGKRIRTEFLPKSNAQLISRFGWSVIPFDKVRGKHRYKCAFDHENNRRSRHHRRSGDKD